MEKQPREPFPTETEVAGKINTKNFWKYNLEINMKIFWKYNLERPVLLVDLHLQMKLGLITIKSTKY
jgi:hypothetical protein